MVRTLCTFNNFLALNFKETTINNQITIITIKKLKNNFLNNESAYKKV